LQLSLVSIPVKAYSVNNASAEIQLNQLHADCHSRVQYKKCCPVHGEVPSDQILSGYEYTKGQYIVIDPDELDRLRTQADKAIQINGFIPPQAFNPLYTTGKRYYLASDGPVGQKGYQVLYQAMVEENRYALAQAVLHGREQLVMLRPQEGLLVLEVLHHHGEVNLPKTISESSPTMTVVPEELQLAKTLIAASTRNEVDWSRYPDRYTQTLMQVIEAKVAGRAIVAPPANEGPAVIQLMEALKQSVAKAIGKDKPPRMRSVARRTGASRKIS
jgi:DNA end-binding protein Ku